MQYTKQRVLYVEDEPVHALLVSALFERLPQCELVLADCGRSALEKSRGLYPSLLMLDLRLPDMPGGELLTQLRQVPGCQFVPAVAVTAEHDYDFAAAGFQEIWLKPMELTKVLERLEGYLGLAPTSGVEPSLSLSTMRLMLRDWNRC
jgi:CheY-like chemotaxis protein